MDTEYGHKKELTLGSVSPVFSKLMWASSTELEIFYFGVLMTEPMISRIPSIFSAALSQLQS